MTPDLIILDCDGVLVDSEPITNAVIAKNLTGYGLPLTVDQSIQLFVGGTMQGVEAEARARGAILPDDWIDEIYALMFAALDEGVPLIPGVVELIALAESQGIALAVASNGPMEKMHRTLKPSGLWDRLSPHIYSRVDHAPKPKPDMLIHAMKMAGITPERTVMIDDATSGCRAARNAGVRCIGYATEGQDDLLRAEGAEVVGSMDDVAHKLGLGKPP